MRLRAAVLASLLAASLAQATPPRSLRVVSYNVLHGGMTSALRGDGERLDERVAIATGRLRALDPDVVGLQEASVGRARGDVAARFGRALDLQHVFTPSRIPLGAAFALLVRSVLGLEEGPAVLSRWPMARSDSIPIARCGELYQRMLLCAEAATPWGPLDLCSTHIDGSTCQAESLLAALAVRPPTRPLVLTADLNAIEHSFGIARLLADGGFVDTFRAANPEAPGPTVWQYIYSERRMARRRVDYVLLRPAAGTHARVVHSRIVLDAPERNGDGTVLWPSDHYGVLSEIEPFPSR
jgi:endonuclease/exonuclease/phosphatase family metal-dependent hydrolase